MKIILLNSLILFFLLGCSNNDPETSPDPDPIPDPEPTIEVEEYDKNLVDKGLVLTVVSGGDSSFLVNKLGYKVHSWGFNNNLGNDLELMENGKLLGMFKPENPAINFGGYGGIVKIINPDNTVDWSYTHSSDQYIAHHDVEMLPNGNVLFLVWERIAAEAAIAAGANVTYDMFPEKLVEVNPINNEIVWEWRSWEHIIQDLDDKKINFGEVDQNPQLINVNYSVRENGDFMHANGLDYDPIKDIVYVSINGYSEVWVVDHSTTIAEASSHSGGNFNKGGDLIYRFGNPEAYNNTAGERLFYNNHFPNLLENGEPGEGNLLIFVNGNNVNQSAVYELELPANFNLIPDTNNEPSVAWSFTDANLYSARISGATRLSNGNTLICEGDFGFWEITQSGQIAWKYNGINKKFWRGYSYDLDSKALENLGLSL